MSRFQKSKMTVDGNNVRVSMPFSKVDKSKRLVSGFATLGNIDSQNDVVLAEASRNAFERARGNIREMHESKAVGKLVGFKEEEFFDKGTGELYRGIYVTAYVSKGAPDTWEKVLDGTLTGFSIGGEINEASNEFVKEAGKTIRFIKDYDLVELSLVDNPANQLANVFSIQKSNTGTTTLKGMVAETMVENVFYCKNDETVIVSDQSSHECPVCDSNMENAGWFESGIDRTEKVQSVLSDFLAASAGEVVPTEAGGGVEMSKSNKEEEKEVSVPNPSETHPDGEKIEESDEISVPVEDEASEDVEEVDEGEAVDEEESDSPEEVEDEEATISKKIDELHEAVKSSLEKTREETSEQVTALEKKIDDATTKFLDKASELESKMGEFGKKLETAKSRLSELEKNLEKSNSSEAIKKSAEYNSVEETVQKKSFWDGAFSG